MVFRKPLTLINDDTWVPSSITAGGGLRQPAKMVSHSSNRCRSEANFQAWSGVRSDDTDTSTFAILLSAFCRPGIRCRAPYYPHLLDGPHRSETAVMRWVTDQCRAAASPSSNRFAV